jgi:hypothetical protein
VAGASCVSCGDDHAPDALRQRILLRLTQIRMETTITTAD